MSLLYSTDNDRPVSREQLAAIPTPPPRGPRHRPYPFGSYVTDVHDALDRVGIQVGGEEYAVTKDHQRMFGVLEIEPKEGELITASEWKLLMGLRGSHDQKIGRGLVLGSQVMVCSNLCFSGNVADFNTKQTTYIGSRLPGLIRDAVMRIPQMAGRQERVYNAYRNSEVKPRWGDAALVEMFRQDGLSSAQLGRAVTEWHEPTFKEHADYGWSVWRLMNAATQALKPTGQNFNADLMAQRSQKVTNVCDMVAHIDF